MSIYPNLVQALNEQRISLEELASVCNISHIKKKIHGSLPFKLSDAVRICLYLNRTDAKYLFFQLDNSKFQLESQYSIGR